MPRRRSIFSFSLRSSKPDREAVQPSPAPTDLPHQNQHHRYDTDTVSLPDDPEARYIPRQWAPNRLATLYVSPSEQNLYLAAMAALDRPAPSLPLWADPAPQLGPMRQQTPLDPTPPVIASPPPLRARLPLSPKLVTSPTLPPEGLSVREEFRRPLASVFGAGPQGQSQHALLAFSDDAQIRFHNFPHATLVAVDEAVKEAWPRGVMSQHPTLASLARPTRGTQGDTWIVVLKGRVWKRAGNAELETIRLVLAVLTSLGVCGWQLVEKVQATGVKYDHHNLLFAYSPHMALNPPAFFALSIPLPDRLSLISPPNKVTPALISAIRCAITSLSQQGQPAGDNGDSPKGRAIEWDAWKGGIRLEGWVHSGVYRFWMDGLRRWLSGAVKWSVVEKLHPPLILALINALGAQNFNLLTSMPLLPLQKGRDILIFQSTPASGLSYQDSWREQPTIPTGDEDAPVMVTQQDAMPTPHEVLPAELHHTRVRRQRTSEEDGVGASQAQGRKHKRFASVDAVPGSVFRNNSHNREPAPVGRLASIDSERPLIPDNASAPRKRNLLLKKTSLRRNGSDPSTGSRSDSSRQRRTSDIVRGDRSKLGPFGLANIDSVGPDAQRQSGMTDALYRSEQPEAVHMRSRHGVGSEFTMDGEPGLGGNWSMVDLPERPDGGARGEGGDGLTLSMYAPGELATGGSHGGGPSLPPPPPIPARNRPDSPARMGTPGYTYTHGTGTGHPFSNRAPSASVPAQTASPDSAADEYRNGHRRDLHIANSTPPPLSAVGGFGHAQAQASQQQQQQPNAFGSASACHAQGHPAPHAPPLAQRASDDTSSSLSLTADVLHSPGRGPEIPLGAKLDLPLSTARPGLRGRGRDAVVDVGSGIGVQSVAGSVGYLGGGASRSVLGLGGGTGTGPETPGASVASVAYLPEPEYRAQEGEVPMPQQQQQQQRVQEEAPPLPARYGERVGSSRTRIAMG